MKEERKTKKQLIEELNHLREQLIEVAAERDKLDKIFRYSHDAIFLFDPERNRILDVNPSACQMLGYSRQELLSLPISAIHPDEMKLFRSFFNTVAEEGDGWTDELSCMTKKNDVLPAEISGSVFNIDNRNCMIAIVRDITERKNAEALLRESEETYRDLFQSAFDVVFMLDKDRNFVDINRRAEELTGYSRSELLGMNYYDLLLPEDREEFEKVFGALASGEEIMFELRWRAKDGSIIQFEGASTPRFSATGEFLTTRCTLRDITARVKAEDKISRQVQRLTALNKIDRTITASLDLQLTLETVLDQLAISAGVDAADILILNQKTNTLVFGASNGFRSNALKNTNLPLGEGLAGKAAMEQRIIHIENLSESSNELAINLLSDEESFVTYHAIPLIAKGQVKGILELFHLQEFNPSQGWLEFLETVARQAAIAIDNLDLFDNLQRMSAELIRSYDSTLEGWVQALDLRDNETQGHTQRVTEMTQQLAIEMGLSEEELVHIQRGSLLHDIGKMGIPDNILHKPAKLTREEWLVMQEHPVLANKMLSNIPFLRPALDIPYSHHEKWDGSGYPLGLSGEQIPLAARIFSIVDVYDALKSDRPYSKAWSKSKIWKYLGEQSGIHFDPKVYEQFKILFKRI